MPEIRRKKSIQKNSRKSIFHTFKFSIHFSSISYFSQVMNRCYMKEEKKTKKNSFITTLSKVVDGGGGRRWMKWWWLEKVHDRFKRVFSQQQNFVSSLWCRWCSPHNSFLAKKLVTRTYKCKSKKGIKKRKWRDVVEVHIKEAHHCVVWKRKSNFFLFLLSLTHNKCKRVVYLYPLLLVWNWILFIFLWFFFRSAARVFSQLFDKIYFPTSYIIFSNKGSNKYWSPAAYSFSFPRKNITNGKYFSISISQA